MQNRENIMKLYISTSKAVCIILVVIAMAAGNKASAQLLPFGSQYFFNQYLANPAFAGAEEGLQVMPYTARNLVPRRVAL
jgi:hypothetical protein